MRTLSAFFGTGERSDSMNTVQSNIIARSVYKELQTFYSNPENVRKFEEWKKKRKQKEQNT